MKAQKGRREHHTGSIFKRKDGRYVVQVQNPSLDPTAPRYITKYARTNAEAVQLLNDLVSQVTIGKTIVTKRQTVAEFLDYWIDSIPPGSLQPKTLSWYRMMIDYHLKPAIGTIDLRKLHPIQIQLLINSKIHSGLAPSSVRGIHAVLRTALNQAWKYEMVAENVAKKVTLPRQKQAEPEFLSAQDAQKLLQSLAGHQIEGLVKLALGTGMRLGEATGLRWNDVNLDTETVRVTGQLQRLEGKLALKILKSRSSRRSLPLIGVALKAVQMEQTRQVTQRSTYRGAEFNPLNLIFLNAEGHPFDPKNVNQHLKAACVRAGIKPVSFHKLRHTAASLMVAAGVELHQVKEQLGHSQISLTANLYAHGVPESQRRAVNILDEVLRSGELPG